MSNLDVNLILKHIDKTAEVYTKKLDRITDTVIDIDKRLSTLSTVVNQIDNRTSKIEAETKEHSESLLILNHEATKKEKAFSSIFFPIMHKSIWAAMCFVSALVVGYGIKIIL